MSNELFQKFDSITCAVQNAMDDRDWMLAAELESERRAELATVIAEYLQSDSMQVDSLIARLGDASLSVARMIGELAHHERKMIREVTMIATGRQAAEAYRTTANEPL
jgi:hypothetical protein